MKRVFVGFAVVFTVFWLTVAAVAILSALFRQPFEPGAVLRVPLAGELGETETPPVAALLGEAAAPSLRATTESIRSAASDSRIRGLVLEVRDPELSAAAIGELEEAMAEFRRSGKWSAAYLETAGELTPGDGALAAAAMAPEIVLAPTGQVNLAGLRLVVPFVKGTLSKLEVQPFVTKRWEYKTAPDTFTQAGFTEPAVVSLSALAGDLESVVTDHIAKRRGVTPDEVRRWRRTGPHVPDDAVAQHMVDSLGYWDELVSKAQSVTGRDDCFVPLGTYARARRIHDHGPEIALIVGAGDIHRGKSSPSLDGGPDMGSTTIVEAFRDAREAGVRGILFRVDSPGGSALASDFIRREVELTRAKGIPVVVSMGSYAASGGYYVTLGANRVLADPGTITGSIGVFAMTFATRRFWSDLLGVTFGVYETTPEAVNLSDLDPPDPRERVAIDADADRIYRDFVAKTAGARGKTPEEIDAVARGRVWSGRAALEHGLVDELGGMEIALRRLKELAGIPAESDVTVREWPEHGGLLAWLRQLTGGNARAELPPSLRRTLATLRRLGGAGEGVRLSLPPGFDARM